MQSLRQQNEKIKKRTQNVDFLLPFIDTTVTVNSTISAILR